MQKQPNKKSFKGFTLVELIIVITILAILGTIAYISFQGYTKDARDSARMSDIKQIYNGISIYKTQTEKTPMPDSYVNILSGTTTISYQGYAGANVLRVLKITGGKDPGTKDYYIYTTDVNQKKSQLMTFMETSDKDVQLLGGLLINQAKAVTNTGYYQDKKIFVYGDKVGIITNNKVPLQETITNTGIDITTLTGNITTYFGGSVYSSGLTTSTGTTLVNQIVGLINNVKVCDSGYTLVGGNCVAQNIDITNSLRFDVNRYSLLTKTFSSSGDGLGKKATISLWVKRSKIGVEHNLFSSDFVSTRSMTLYFGSNDKLRIGNNNFDRRSTTNTFTDTNKWYHILAIIDFNNSTPSERVKLYVDGVEQTYSSSTDPDGTQNTGILNGAQNAIGSYQPLTTRTFDGYISEVNLIDGQILGPTNFGVNVGGKWLPKTYAGIYGANGFHLDFKDGTNLGKDVSGNNNNWTALGFDKGTVIPTMNGDTSPVGTAISNGIWFGTNYNAFNPDGPYWIPPGGNNGWIGYDFGAGNSKIIKGFSFRSDGVTRTPRDFTFDAWNGSAWVTLATFSGYNTTYWNTIGYIDNGDVGGTPILSVSNNTAYQKYRIYTSSHNDSSHVVFDYIELFETLTPSSSDQVIDSPTNDFSVLNLGKSEGPNTLSNGNLTVLTNTTNWNYTLGSKGVSSGKYYWETIISKDVSAPSSLIGIATSSATISGPPSSANWLVRWYGSQIQIEGASPVSYGTSYTKGDIIGIYLNLDNNEITFYKNGATQGVKSISSGKTWYPYFSDGSGDSVTYTANFGQGGQYGLQYCSEAGGYFKYCPSTGYKSLSNKNTGN